LVHFRYSTGGYHLGELPGVQLWIPGVAVVRRCSRLVLLADTTPGLSADRTGVGWRYPRRCISEHVVGGPHFKWLVSHLHVSGAVNAVGWKLSVGDHHM
jgi:hypothetical protein